MLIRNLSLTLVLAGTMISLGGCNRPADPQPVVVHRPIMPPPPAEPRVDVGGPRGGVHVDVPRADGPDIRVDVPPLRNPPVTTP